MATPKAIGAKFDFTSLKGEEVETPKQTRARKANPYLPLVDELVMDGPGKRFTGIPYGSEADKEAVAKWVLNVQAAGRVREVTIRKFVAEDSKAKTAEVTFWKVSAIKRERGE